jgi:predicted enzyme related to lactoylglutathione lyase
MKIVNVVFPVVVENFGYYRATVDYYSRVLGLPVRAESQHAGISVSSLGPIVIVGAENALSLDIPRQVNAIFIVDNLEEAWGQVEAESEVLVAPETVPSGGRFVVRHTQGDRRVVEYLDLRNLERVLTR